MILLITILITNFTILITVLITENNYLLLLGERRRQPLAHLVRHGVGLQLGEVVVGLLPKDNFSL